MKRIFRYVALLVLTLTLVVAICACGAAGITKPQPSEGAKTYEVKGSVKAEKLNDTTIRVNCEANIETGAVLAITIEFIIMESSFQSMYSKRVRKIVSMLTLQSTVSGRSRFMRRYPFRQMKRESSPMRYRSFTALGLKM